MQFQLQDKEKENREESNFFKPKVGRAPEKRATDTFGALYYDSIVKEERRKQRILDSNEKLHNESVVQANPISAKLN